MIGNRGTSGFQYVAAELFESELDDNTKACDHVHTYLLCRLGQTRQTHLRNTRDNTGTQSLTQTLTISSLSGGVRRRRVNRAVVLMLSTIAMLAKNVASFNMVPNPVSRNGDVGNTIRTSSPVTHLPKTQQRSSPLNVADDTTDTTGLPDVARAVFAEDKRPVLLYDGVCNMCNGFVNRFLDVDKEEKFRFSALQSEAGRSLLALSGRSPDDISRSVRHRHAPRSI